MKKTLITLSLFTSLGAIAQNGGIAINNTGQNPNANSMLDIQSDNKGVLIPRLTTVARNTLGTALALPDNGMMVYDKNMNLFFYWDGTQWVQVGSGSGDNWGTQVVQTSGTNISGDGTTGNPLTVTDGDSDPTNEIELPTGGTNGQVLSTDGSGTYTWVNDNAGTDNQNIQNLAFDASTNILTVGIQNGNSQTVDLTGLLNDADSDPTNEIQDLSLNTTTNILTITNNGTPTNIDLTPYLDNTDNQDLSLTGNTLSLTNDATPVDLSGYLDNTDSQNLTNTTAGSNVTVNISGGTGTTFSINDADSDPTNEIELPTGGTNGQVLSTNGSGTYTWVTDNTGTDNQDLSLTGNTLSLTNDGTPVDLSSYLDNTDNQNISGSGLSGTVLTIGIQNGTNETVDLASLTDADWYKVGTTSAPSSINDNIFTQGRVGIGTSTPKSNIDIVGTRQTTIYPSNSIFKMGGADVFLYGGAHSGGLGINYPIMLQAMRDSDSLQFPISLNPNGGNIGIGTLSPTEKLEIQGSIKIVDGTQAVGKVLTSDATGKGSWQNAVPAGMVNAFAGATAPAGYLICDGSAVSRTTYADLFAVIGTTYGAGDGSTTFNLPDLRGEFIRGFDAGRGVDNGRTLGSWQVATAFMGDGDGYNMPIPNLNNSTHKNILGFELDKLPQNTVPVTSLYTSNLTSTCTYTGLHANGTASTCTDFARTRPRNIAMNYCIKY